MSPDDYPPRNPFVRFKQHVDARISAGLQGVLGLPSFVTQSFNARDSSSNYPGAETRLSRHDHPSDHHASSAPSPSTSSDFDDWLFEQREAAANELMLDRYYEGHGIHEHMRRWQIFAFGSRYSPLRLAMLPKQPCPRDISDGMDPSMFTFVDAFEDLLAESSGQPMMDLRTRYEMNQLLARMWPRGEHPLSWFSRLESQDLSKTYFRYGREQHTPARMDDWAEMTSEEDRDKLAWGEIQEADTEKSEKSPLAPPRQREFVQQTSLFGELDKAFKELAKVLEDEISSFGHWRRPNEQQHQKKEGEGQHPDAEEDLYSAVQSAYHDAERSLSNFIKSFSEGRSGIESRRNDIRTGDAPATSGDEVREDESGKTIKSTEEFVDAFGNMHVKTEIRRMDWDGNEVARETHYSVRPVSQTRTAQEESPENVSRGEEVSPGKDGKFEREDKSGWFWK